MVSNHSSIFHISWQIKPAGILAEITRERMNVGGENEEKGVMSRLPPPAISQEFLSKTFFDQNVTAGEPACPAGRGWGGGRLEGWGGGRLASYIFFRYKYLNADSTPIPPPTNVSDQIHQARNRDGSNLHVRWFFGRETRAIRHGLVAGRRRSADERCL